MGNTATILIGFFLVRRDFRVVRTNHYITTVPKYMAIWYWVLTHGGNNRYIFHHTPPLDTELLD